MPTTAEIHKKLRGKHTFPDTSTIAEFRYRSQAILLSTIARAQFETQEHSGNFIGARDVAGIIYHEITHWADMTSTLWGRQYLCEVYDALALLGRLNEEEAATEFWRMISVHDRGRRLLYPDYYKVHEGDAQAFGRDTHIDVSGGLEFDTFGRQTLERPIIFVRFRGPNNEVFVRQPLTVGPLLETTAVWSEARTWLEVAEAMPEGERAVERALILADLEGLASDPNLTLYTAPVRMFEQFARVANALVAYEAAAKISQLCLNLDADQFAGIVLPGRINAWGERNDASRRNQDPAFAFAAILLNAGEMNPGQSVSEWLDLGLRTSGLPNAREVLSLATERMRGEVEMADSQWSGAGRYLLSAGKQVAEMRLRTLDPAITPNLCRDYALPLPPLIDSDLVIGRLPTSSFDYSRYDPEAMYHVEWDLEEGTNNFLGACR